MSLFRRLISDDEYTGASETTSCFVCEMYYRFACYIVIAALLPARFSHYCNASYQRVCILIVERMKNKKKRKKRKKKEHTGDGNLKKFARYQAYS